MTPSRSASRDALVDQLEAWMNDLEGEDLEFKEAKRRYSFDDLCKYCCALANEGGGKVILGVTNKRPRKVVGSEAFAQIEEHRRSLTDKIPLRIDVLEIQHPKGRVLVFEIPSHPVGTPIKFDGIYWSRDADSLVPMAEDRLRLIFAEAGHDFSADVCPGAGMDDLEIVAIEEFRRRWMRKSGNKTLETMPADQLLRDAELVADGGVTYAALILFGTRKALGRLLGQAEVIFEYRSSDVSGPAQQRKEYRQGFFSFYDDLWSTVNMRNDLQHYQDGLFVYDIATFDERSVREAVLNAISHRDYQLGGSVFVRQFTRRLVIESPGGLPVGITLENVLDQQSPRNRRVAEAFARCGLVERSGQGMNLMFQHSISQGKARPDFTGTDNYVVVLALHGEIQDPEFLRYLQEIGNERAASFSTDDFLVIDIVHRGQPVPDQLKPRIDGLLEKGVIERIGRGRGTKLLLSQRFYRHMGKSGVYTRKKGLDRNTNKALLLKHITENAGPGSKMVEMKQVLPALSRSQIQVLVRELAEDGDVHVHGKTRAALWYPGPKRPDCNH